MLSFLKYLVTNNVSLNMLANYISAAKANFTRLGLEYSLWDHPNVKCFLASSKINRPFKVVKCHVIDLETLQRLVRYCDLISFGIVYKAVFLVGYFGFLRLSNIAPRAIASFDPSLYLTAGNIIFTERLIKLVIKWSKTIQTRGSINCLTLSRLKGSIMCPLAVYKAAMKLNMPSQHDTLFQMKVGSFW